MPPPSITDVVTAPSSRAPRSGRWLGAIVLVVIAGAFAWWWSMHQRDAGGARTFPRDPELARIRELIFGLDATVADYGSAEARMKALLAQRPEDPEVVIVAAEVNNWYYLRGFDRREVRLWDMRSLARRALTLAPEQPEAIAAMGEYLLASEAELPRAAELLRNAIARDPSVPRWYSSLAEVLRIKDPAAGLAVLQDAVQRFPRDVLVRYNLARHYRDTGRPDDMERELDAVIAMQPIANALLWKARVRLWGHGDRAGMKAALDQVPEKMRISERAVVNLFVYACVAGEFREALAMVRALPSTWINDYDFVGPKSLLLAILLDLQGDRDQARLEYQNAYAEVARRRLTDNSDPTLRTAELWTLIGLDRREEARAAYNIFFNKVERPYRLGFSTSWWFSEIPAAVVLEQFDTARQLLREAAASAEDRRQLQIALQVDPRMQPLRDDPAVVAALAPSSGSAP